MINRKINILIGPTAVGKTEYAIEWAKSNKAEILSCDSLLFYEGMDIGTAKPSKKELSSIAHFGIDICSVDKQMNIKYYIEYAQNVILDIFSRGKNVLVVGGNGFYIKSFFEPVIDCYEIDKNTMSNIEKIYETFGLEEIVDRLRKINSGVKIENFLDLKNPVRVKKALARCISSKLDLEILKNNFLQQKSPFFNYEKNIFLLQREENDLKQRVFERIKNMINEGLIDEVKTLLQKGILKNATAKDAIGYRETIEYLQNIEYLESADEISRKLSQKEKTESNSFQILKLNRKSSNCSEIDNIDKLKNEIYKNTLKLIKKQKTWFKKLPVNHIINLRH